MAASADNAPQHPRVCHTYNNIFYNTVRKFPNLITIPIKDVSARENICLGNRVLLIKHYNMIS